MEIIKKEIIIIGAGIGGLTTAIALHQQGFYNLTIFERRNSATTIGAGLVLWANATKILHKLNLLEEIKQVSGAINEMQRWSKKNEYLGTIKTSEINKKIGFPSLAISRKELQEILLKKIEFLNIKINYNAKVVAIKNSSVIFEDEHEVKADIIIGADGRMNSTARKYVNGDNKPVYQNFVNWIGIIESKEPIFIENKVLDFWGCGERFGIVPINRYKGYWAGAKSLPLNSHYKNEDNKDLLIKLFGHWSSNINQIIQLTPSNNIKHIEVFDHNPIKKWHKDNVCLLGDASHAALPTSGQGACQAIEDAFHFATILKKEKIIENAFIKFQKIRFEKTTIITMAGRDFAKSLFNTDEQFCIERNKRAMKVDYKKSSIGIAELWSKNLPN